MTQRRLPASYQDATWRGVLPIDQGIDRMGVSFEVGDTCIRLAISWRDAEALIDALECYLSPHERMSSLMSCFTMAELDVEVSKQDYVPQRLLTAPDRGPGPGGRRKAQL